MGMGDPFGIGNHQLRLVNPLQATQFRGKVLKFLRGTTQRNQLHAQIMGQMHMHRRDNTIAMLVLDLDHLFRQVGSVMIKDKGQTGCDIPLLPLPCVVRQLFPQ